MIRFMLLALLALSACTTGTDAESAAASEAPEPTPTPTPTPTRQDDDGGDTGDETLTGIFGADAVEGGCAYLETDDGTRYEVLYPSGWSVQAEPLQLRNPDDEVVATGGETITVRGTHAGEMASICMIGPIFEADEVVEIEE